MAGYWPFQAPARVPPSCLSAGTTSRNPTVAGSTNEDLVGRCEPEDPRRPDRHPRQHKDPLRDEQVQRFEPKSLRGSRRVHQAAKNGPPRKTPNWSCQRSPEPPPRSSVSLAYPSLKRQRLESFVSPSRKIAKWANSEKASSSPSCSPKAWILGLRMAAEGVALGAYRFVKYFTGDRKPKKSLESVVLGLQEHAGKAPRLPGRAPTSEGVRRRRQPCTRPRE